MKKTLLAAAISSVFIIAGCTKEPATTQNTDETMKADLQQQAEPNLLLTASPLTYQAPQFDKISDDQFLPAFEQGMKAHAAEIDAIANNAAAPTFENTLVALEKSGALLTRVSRVFYNLSGSDSNPKRRELQQQLAPKLAAHSDNINLNEALFKRVETLYNQRETLSLDAESLRLLETTYDDFVYAGARLNEEQKQKVRQINEAMSSLTTKFSQNLLAESKAISVVVTDRSELEGLSERQINAMAEAAKSNGHEGSYLISITNTTRQPILSSLENRALRQRVWEASANRAQSGDNDNREIVLKLARLRAEKAALMGYESWAEYSLQRQMAGKPEAVYSMLDSMVPAVIENVEKEAADIQRLMNAELTDAELQPWDWAYYAEKVRQARYDLNESEVKQYFEFNRVLEDGVFYTMNKLFGIRFEPRSDLPVYHPDVKAYELFDIDGKSLAIFYADYFARDGKRGGAWMSSFVGQSKLLNQKPVVVNVMNIEKAPEGEPTLVSYDNVTT
ncbi:MAG: dipeptidyl carboxypeptidase, partial [Alteromonas sp. Nap_26]